MRSYRFRLAVIAIMVAASAPLPWLIADSVVGEQPKVAAEPLPPLEGAEKLKDAAKARVSAEAQALIEKVAAAYQKLTSLELAGTVTLATDDGTNKRLHEATLSSSYQAPNRFKHQMKDQAVLGSTGEKVYAFSGAENLFLQEEAAKEKVMLSDLPRVHTALLRVQNPSLVLAISKDPAAEFRVDVDEITLAAEAEEIDGKKHPALKFTVEGGERMTMLLDPQTLLVRRVVTDLRLLLEKNGRSGMNAALYTVDYTTVKADAPIGAEQFAWAVPAGARDLAKMVSRPGGQSPLVGNVAPDFTLDGLDGQPVTMSDLRGSVVVLEFWATWCGPCVMAMPGLDKISKEMGKEGLKVFAVNVREGPEKVKSFLEAKGLSIPVLYDAEGEVYKQYGEQGMPTRVIVGKDGVVKNVELGFDPNGDAALRALLKEELGAKYQAGK